jgi:hypothetical protein
VSIEALKLSKLMTASACASWHPLYASQFSWSEMLLVMVKLGFQVFVAEFFFSIYANISLKFSINKDTIP